MKMCGLNAALQAPTKSNEQIASPEKKKPEPTETIISAQTKPEAAPITDNTAQGIKSSPKPEPNPAKALEEKADPKNKPASKPILPSSSFGTVSIKQTVKNTEEKKRKPSS